ncbi:MAG TPA: hypothetical protein VGG79_05310 [Roseiarcus sp.]
MLAHPDGLSAYSRRRTQPCSTAYSYIAWLTAPTRDDAGDGACSVTRRPSAISIPRSRPQFWKPNRKTRLSAKSIAPAIVFLSSDEAFMVSGATYDVTGGDSASYTA